MDLAIITEAFLQRDGVGRSILSKVRYLESQGHRVTIYMESFEHLTMPEMRSRVRQTNLREILLQARAPKTVAPGVVAGFFDHDAYLFEYPTYFPLIQAARALPHKPVIFDYYGVTPAEYFPDPQAQDFIRRSIAETRLLSDGAMVLVHSRSSADELLAQAPVSAARVRVLPIALDPRYAAPPPEADVARVRRELGLDGRFVMLYVGRVAGNKGVDTLIAALAALQRDVPEALLLVAGEDRRHGYEYFRGYSLTRALELKVERSVRFLGQVDEPTLHALYAAAHVLVSASLHEGFGMPVAEAQATGTPCVVTRSTALPETAGDGALYFEPRDAVGCAAQLSRVAREPGLRAALAERARANAARFTPAVVGAGLVALIDEARQLPARAAHEAQPLLEAAARLTVSYKDELSWPVVGPLFSWVRRKLTLHLEKFFLRPLQQNLQLYAQLSAEEIASLRARVAALSERVAELEAERAASQPAPTRPSSEPEARERSPAP